MSRGLKVWRTPRFLGLVMAGMGLGAVAAGVWIVTGGSLLIAFAIYSLVATAFVLGAAIVSFLFSELPEAVEPAASDVGYPAE